MVPLGINGRIRCRSGVKRSTCNPFFRPFWPRRGSGPSSGVDVLIVTVKVLSFLIVTVRFRFESIVVGIVGRSGEKKCPVVRKFALVGKGDGRGVPERLYLGCSGPYVFQRRRGGARSSPQKNSRGLSRAPRGETGLWCLVAPR